jgi:hypothetical protein
MQSHSRLCTTTQMAEYAIGKKEAPFHSLAIPKDTHNEDREKKKELRSGPV